MLGACGVDSLAAAFFESGHEILDRTGLALVVVIPTAEHLQECPLGPLVIPGITSADFTVPIV